MDEEPSCMICGDYLAPPIYTCGNMPDHFHCEKCIFQVIRCTMCMSSIWKRSTEFEEQFDPEVQKDCPVCGFEGNILAVIDHTCPFTQIINCPLEDPYCPFKAPYSALELGHILKEHVNPVSMPQAISDPIIYEDGTFFFSHENVASPEDSDYIGENFPPNDLDEETRQSSYPGNGEPHQCEDNSPYRDAPRLAIIEDQQSFTMICKKINYPGFYRYNVLLKINVEFEKTTKLPGISDLTRGGKKEKTHGFLCSLQHYERSNGLNKYRAAVYYLGSHKKEAHHKFRIKFKAGYFEIEKEVPVLSLLENMHKLCPEDILEIHNNEFNNDYSISRCEVEFHHLVQEGGEPRPLQFEPEPVIKF